MRPICHVLAVMLAALPGIAAAQARVEFLPPLPEIAPDPARDVAPPEDTGDAGPVPPADGGGPGFVLNGIVLDGAEAIPPAELAPIWADVLGQPVTLATLDEIVVRIGAAYRARGYLLSQAALPAQTVEGGIVHIVVVEGFVDRVALTGGAPNQQRIAERMFAPVPEERPLRLETLERSVLLARDTFGSTFGTSVETVLEPSPTTFGAADLGVLITPEPVTGFGTIDNRGSRLYGEWTLGAGVRSYNLLGMNERLDGLVAYAPDDSSLAFGSVTLDAPIEPLYGTFLNGGRIEIGGSVSRSDPDLTKSGSPQGLTNILDQTELSARLVVPFVRTRSQNVFGRVGLTFLESDSENAFAGSKVTETDRLNVLDMRATWDFADRIGGVNLVDVALRQGLDIGGADVASDSPAAGKPDFTAARATVSRLQAVGAGAWSVYGEVIAQYAANVLPNSERFFLGNSTVGRGFAPGNTSGDSGYGARLELRRHFGPEAFGSAFEATELYAFGDYGQAYDRSIDRDGARWETLSSVGFGARIDIRPWLSITPEIARQTDGVANDTTESGLETRAYIGAIARF